MSELQAAEPKPEKKEKKGMKKSTRIVLLVLSILFFLGAIVTPIVIFAMPNEKDRYIEKTDKDFILRYDPDAQVYDIVRYIGDDTVVVVPSEIDGVPVRDILPDAFNAEVRNSNKSITSVTIEDGIKNVGQNAFKGCESLEELGLPASVEKVGPRAFEGSGVKELKVKDASVLKFEEDALEGAEDLTKLTIEGATNALGSGDLGDLSGNLSDVEIGENVVVGSGALEGATNITTLSVYNFSDLVVDSHAFTNTNITTLNIYKAEDTLTQAFMQKFANLTKLATINLDAQITAIGPEAFNLYPSLALVSMGNGTKIDVSSLPVNTVGQLKVTMVAAEGQENNLTLNITNDSGNADYNVLRAAFANRFEQNKITTLILSENFTDIGEDAFAAYSALTKLEFGASSKVRIIGENAFGSASSVSNLKVYGPEKGENEDNYVYGVFNRASGRYSERYSYNDEVTLGSYYINLNYAEGYNENNPTDPVPSSFARRVDILVGHVIADYLPKQTGDQDRLVQGYTLVGWGSTPDTVDEELVNQAMSSEYNDITLYAIWIPGDNVRYTITYYVQSLAEPTEYEVFGDPFEGEDDGKSHLHRLGITGTTVGGEELKVAITGFHFVESAANGKRSKISDKLASDGSTELYLYYDRDVYEVHFDLNDQTDSVTHVKPEQIDWEGVSYKDRDGQRYIEVTFGSIYGALPTPTRAGYEFLGWFTSASGDTQVEQGDDYGLASGTTLYAKWQAQAATYSIEVYLQNTDNDLYSPDNGRFQTDIAGNLADALLTIEGASIRGFEFEKMTYTASYQTSEQNFDGEIRICGDNSTVVKLYYKRMTYTISYNLNDGETGTAHVQPGSSIEGVTMRYGQRYILPEVARDGYTLVGWNLSADRGSTWITGESTVPMGEVGEENAQTLYAIWENNTYKVHYDKNNEKATGEMADSTHVYEVESALSANEFEYTGYHFTGWCETSVPGDAAKIYEDLEHVSTLTTEAYTDGQDGKGVVTLYAQWAPNHYRVVYEANNEFASGSTAASEMTYDQDQALTPNGFEVTGYHFAYWYQDNTQDPAGQEHYEDQKTVKNLTDEDNDIVHLYAHWEPNTYTVHFDGGDGATGSMNDVTATYGREETLPKNEPDSGNGFKKDGFTFGGWYLTREGQKEYGDGASFSNLTDEYEGEVTLHAVWDAIVYHITLYYNDSTDGSETVDVTLLSATLPRTHEYAGYTLLGFSDESGESEVNSQLDGDITAWLKTKILANETEGLKVYMIWSADADTKYTLEYYLQQLNPAESYSTYYLGEASGSKCDEQTVYTTDQTLTVDAQTLIGYFDASIFTGFEFDAETTNGQNSVKITGDGKAVIKLYFKRCVYTVNFDMNKAEGTTGTIAPDHLDPLHVTYGAPYIVDGAFQRPTRGGYAFLGWSTTGEQPGIINASELYNTAGESTLKAVWQKSTATYNIEVYLQKLGLNKEQSALAFADFDKDLEHSHAYTANTDEEHTVSAETITGFTYYKPEFVEATELTLSIDGDGKTVYRLFYTRNKIDVNFKVDGQDNQKQYEFGANVQISDVYPADPQKDGYTFQNWEKDGEEVEDFTVGDQPIEVEAKFEENTYEITINENMTESVLAPRNVKMRYIRAFLAGSQTILYTGSIDLYEAGTQLERVGYTLVGFAFDSKSTEDAVTYKWDTLSQQHEVKVSQLLADDPAAASPYPQGTTITLYAIWKVNNYTVKYVDGSSQVEGGSHDYDEEFTLKDATTFTKEGYYFERWQDKNHTENYYNVGEETNMPAYDLELTPEWKKDTFYVVYDANRGSASTTPSGSISPVLYTFDGDENQNIAAATTFTLRGYTFQYWYTTANGVDGTKYEANAVADTAMVRTMFSQAVGESAHEKQFTLYAIWKANTYTLRVHDNFNGNEETKDVTMTFDESYTLSNSDSKMSFTHAGYEFFGWNTSSEFTTEPTYKVGDLGAVILNVLNGDQEGAGNIYDIYCMWQASGDTTYTVIHHKQDLSGSYDTDTETEYGHGTTDTMATANPRSYDGFHQNMEKADQTTGKITGDGQLKLHVYYDRNTYSIEFEANDAGKSGDIKSLKGGTSLEDLTKTITGVKFGDVISNYGSIPTAEEYAKNGYTFLGWFTEPESGDSVTSQSTFTWFKDTTLKLYAHWEAKEIDYTVEYHLQNITDDSYTLADDKGTMTYRGTTDTAIDIESIKREFTGFTYDHSIPPVLGKINGNGSTIQLYYTRDTFTITLNKREGIATFSAEVEGLEGTSGKAFIEGVRYGAQVTLSHTMQKGYNFDHYYDGTTRLTIEASFKMPNNNYVLYANATPKEYTITYDANGGTPDTAEGATGVAYNTSITTLGAETFTRTGYSLIGWSLKSDNSTDQMIGLSSDTQVSTLFADDASVSNSTITLYAVWKANTVTFVFHANGGTNEMSQETFVYDDEGHKNLPQNTFEKVGYNFAHWAKGTEDSATDAELFLADAAEVYNKYNAEQPTSTIHLWAIWAAKQYTVTYKANDNDDATGLPSPSTFTFDASNQLAELGLLSRKGYTFLGWSLNEEATEADHEQIWEAGHTFDALDNTISPDGSDVSVYAIWKAHTYKVAYNKGKDLAEKVQGTMDESTYTFDAQVILQSVGYTYAGYEFAGWATEEDNSGIGGTKVYDDHETIAANALYDLAGAEDNATATLYACWTVQKSRYEIRYFQAKVEGDYDESPFATETKYDDTDKLVTFEPDANKYPGFMLDEAKNNNLSGTVSADGLMHIDVYYKRITYHVSFENATGDYSSEPEELPSQVDVVYGGSLSEVANKEYTRTGYTFAGWFYDADASEGRDVKAGDTYTYTTDITVYAKWTPALASKYTIQYFYQKFDGTYGESADKTEEKTNILTDSVITISPEAKEGFITPAAPAKQRVRADGTTVFTLQYVRSTIKLVLQRTEGVATFTATASEYELGAGSTAGLNTTYTVKWGATITLAATAAQGYTLVESYTFVSGTSVEAGYSSPFELKAALTLKATAKANVYTINYDKGLGDAGTAEAASVAYNASLTFNNGESFTREGYTFVGWAFDKNAISADFDTSTSYAGSAIMAKYIAHESGGNYDTQSITVYAIFKAATWTITYKANYEGAEQEDRVEHYEFAKGGYTYLDANTFTRTGYTFTQWQEISGEQLVPEKFYEAGADLTVEARNFTLVPVWVANTYNVNFYNNYKDASAEEQTTHTTKQFTFDSEENTMAEALTRDGYTFLGWSLQKSASAKTWDANENVKNAVSATGVDTDVYGVWSVNVYSITYDAGTKGTGSNKASVAYDNKSFALSDGEGFSRTGYHFMGWAFEADASEAKYGLSGLTISGSQLAKDYAEFKKSEFTSPYPSTTITLYAIWAADTNVTYKVEYYKEVEAKGGTFAESAYTTKTYNDGTSDTTMQVSLIDMPEGFVLKTDNENIVENQVKVFVNPDGTGVTKVYLLRKQITITFDGNDPHGDNDNELQGGPEGVEGGKATYVYKDVEDHLPNHGYTFKTEGSYNFMGWSITKTEVNGEATIEENAGLNDIIIENVEGETGEITLYAVWSAGQVVVNIVVKTQDLDPSTGKPYTGSDGFTPSEKFTQRQTYRVTATTDELYTLEEGTINSTYLIDGFEFNKERLSTEQQVLSVTPQGTAATITVYLVRKTVTVTFANGISNDETRVQDQGPAGFTAYFGANINTILSGVESGWTYTGHDFAGWLYNGALVSSQASATITEDDLNSLAFTASWTAHKFTVKFETGVEADDQDAVVTGPSAQTTLSLDYDKTFRTPSATGMFTRTGYTLTGFKYGEDKTLALNQASVKVNTLADELGIAGQQNGTITLTAQWQANKYTLKLDAQGGTFAYKETFGHETVDGDVVTLGQFDYNASIKLSDYITGISKTGHDFEHFSFGGKEYGLDATLDRLDANGGEVVLTAVWTRHTYTLQVEVIGEPSGATAYIGSQTSVSSQSFAYEAAFTVNVSLQPGYHFVGWYNSKTELDEGHRLSQVAKYSSTMPLQAENGATYTIYASVARDEYNIEYHALTYINGKAVDTIVGGSVTADSDSANPSKVHYGDEPITLKAVANPGFSFTATTGWFLNEGCTSQATVTAEGKFTITLQSGDGATIHLYAKFVANSYKVVFDKVAADAQIEFVDSQPEEGFEVFYGEKHKVSEFVSSISRNGYTFTGFKYNDSNYELTSEFENLTTTNGEKVTLKAEYSAHAITVAFDKNNDKAEGNIDQIVLTFGDTAGKAIPTEGFTLTGYTFQGWALASAKTEVVSGITGTLTAEEFVELANVPAPYASQTVTLYAVWAANTYGFEVKVYTQVGDSNDPTLSPAGGSVAAANSIKYDGTVTMNATANKGYSFVGYYSSDDFSVEALGSSARFSSQVATMATMTVAAGATGGYKLVQYALFKANYYTLTIYEYPQVGLKLTLSLDGDEYGTLKYSEDTYSYTISLPTSVSVTISASNHLDYNFEGWYQGNGTDGSKQSGTQDSFTTAAMAEGGLVYTINYTAKTYTLKFSYSVTGSASGNETTEGTTITTGQSIKLATLYADAFKADFEAKKLVLTGWKLSATGDKASYTADQAAIAVTSLAQAVGVRSLTNSTGDIVLHAVYASGTVAVSIEAQLNGTKSTTGGTAYITNIGDESAGNVTSYPNAKLYIVNTAENSVLFNTVRFAASAKSGYTIKNWSENCNAPESTSSQNSASLTLDNNEFSVNFTEKEYTYNFTAVTFRADGTTKDTTHTGGTITPTAGTKYKFGATISLTATVSSAGYSFMGWFTNANCTGSRADTPGEGVNSTFKITDGSNTTTRTLYAKFVANKFAVTFDANKPETAGDATWSNVTGYTEEGSDKSAYKKDFEFNQPYGTLPSIKITGWDFVGWFDTQDNVGGNAIGTTCELTAAKTYYARYSQSTFLVTLHNFYAGSSAKPNSATSGDKGGTALIISTTSQPSINAASSMIQVAQEVTIRASQKTGYSFDGWFDSEEDIASGTKSTRVAKADSAETTFTMTAEEINLYAKFLINSFNVTLTPRAIKADSATSVLAIGDGTGTGTLTGGDKSYDYGTSISIKAQEAAGYSFAGWFKNEACDQPYFDAKSNGEATHVFTMPNEAVTIYAKFVVKSFTITTAVYTRDTAGATPTTTAYGNALTINKVIGDSDNLSVTTGKVYYGQSVAFTETLAAGFTREGFYTTYASASGTFSNAANLGSGDLAYTMPAKDTTIYALYSRNSFTISVEARHQDPASVNTIGALSAEASTTGGTVSLVSTSDTGAATASSTIYYGKNFTAYAKAAAGYTFVGWYLSTDTTFAHATSTSATLTLANLQNTKGSTTTYYARFIKTPIQVTVTKGYRNTGAGSAISTDIAGTGTTQATVKITEEQFTMPEKNTKGYFAGFEMNLVATQATGYTFKGWFTYNNSQLGSAAVGSTLASTYTPAAATSLIALFERNSYTISATARYQAANATHGLASLADVPADSSIGFVGSTASPTTVKFTATVYYGDDISLYAVAKAGYVFDGWYTSATCGTSENYGGTSKNTTSPIKLSAVKAGQELFAKFIPAELTYSAAVKGQTAASATTLNALADDVGGSITTTKSGKVYHGQDVSFTAQATNGYTFVGWFADAACATKYEAKTYATDTQKFTVSGQNTLTIKFAGVTSNVTVYAKFVPTVYNNVTLSIGYINNGSETDIATAKAGTGTTAASVTKNTSTISYTDYTGATKTGWYVGQNISVTATKGTGYTFKGWYKGTSISTSGADTLGTSQSTAATWATLAVSSTATTYYAIFTRDSFTVEVTSKYAALASGKLGALTEGLTGGTVSINSAAQGETNPFSKTIYYGDQVTIVASPKTGYVFAGYFTNANGEDGKVSNNLSGTNNNTYKPTVTAAITLVARFNYSELTVSVTNKFIRGSAAGTIESKNSSILQTGTTGGSVAGAGVFYNQTFSATATITEGYYLKGIYSNDACTTAAANATVSGTSVSITNITASATYYALFVMKTYNLTLQARMDTAKNATELNTGLTNGGGTLEITTAKATNSTYGISGWFVGFDVALSVKTTNTGYKEGGFFTDAGCTSTKKLESNAYNGANTLTNGASVTVYGLFNIQKYAATVTGFFKNADGTHSLASTLNPLTATQGTVGTSSSYYYGQSYTFTATPTANWQVAWYSDASCQTASTATITTISTDAAKNNRWALFTPKELTVSVKSATRTATGVNTLGSRVLATTGVSSNAVNNKVYYGQTVTYTATARDGYTFVAWFTGTTTAADGTRVSTNATYTTAAITANQAEIYALYISTPYTLSVTAYYQAKGDATNALAAAVEGTVGGTVSKTAEFTEYSAINSKFNGYFVGTGYTVALTSSAKTADGYEFIGWYSKNTFGSTDKLSSGTITKTAAAQTYFGLFAIKSVTISVAATYNAAATATTYAGLETGTTGGTVNIKKSDNTTAASTGARVGQTVTLQVTKTNPGYVFVGWFNNEACTGNALGTGTSLTYTATTTASQAIYAKFIQSRVKVTVAARKLDPTNAVTIGSTLTAGGGTVSIATVLSSATNSDTSVATTASATEGYILYGKAPSLSQTKATDYTFTKWQLSSGSTYAVNTAITANTTIYGVFTFSTKYTLTLKNYYKTAASPTTLTTTATEGTTYGEATLAATYTSNNGFYKGQNILPYITTTTTKGAFEALYTGMSSGTPSSAVGSTYTLTANGTLYAVYVPGRYTVSINSASETATNGMTLGSLAADAAGTAAGKGGTVKFDQAVFTASTGTTTKASEFARGTNYYAYVGSTVKVSATATGLYIVSGWYSNSTCTASIKLGDGKQTSLQASVTGATTAYAKFTTASFKVTLGAYMKKAASATGSLGALEAATTAAYTKFTATDSASSPNTFDKLSGTVTFYYGYTITLSATPTAAFKLTDWYDNAGCTSATDATITATSSSSLAYGTTLIKNALFTMKSYVVTLNAHAPSGTVSWASADGWSTNGNTATRTLYAASGTCSMPTVTLSGYAFKGWYTAASGGTVKTDAVNSAYAAITYHGQWQSHFTIQGRTQSIASLRTGDKSYDSNLTLKTTTGNATVAIAAEKVDGYTFDGWYTDAACTKGVTSTWVSGSGDSRELTIPGDATTQATYYAKYIRNSSKITIQTYSKSGSTYSLATHGTFTVKSTTANSTLVNASAATSAEITTYYAESYTITTTASTYYKVVGFATVASGVPSEPTITTTSYTFTYTTTKLQVLFQGENVTVRFATGNKTATMPGNQTVAYGDTLSVAYGFNAYAVTYWRNSGFATGVKIIDRATTDFKSTSKISVVINTANVTISGSSGSYTATLTAQWTAANFWLVARSSSADLALDDFARGYTTFDAALAALNGSATTVVSGTITLNAKATISSSLVVSKTATIKGASATTEMGFSGAGMLNIKAATTINTLKVTGTTTADAFFMVSAAVELKFGSSGTTTTVSAVSGKSIFSSSTSGATITLHTATITDCTTGSGLAEGSIIYLSAGAKGSMTASVITGHKAAGNQMFYISGSTTARSSLTVSGCTIGSTTAANSATGSSFDAVFYVNYGTLSFTKNGSTLNSIVMSDQRAVYAIGSGASITGETNIS